MSFIKTTAAVLLLLGASVCSFGQSNGNVPGPGSLSQQSVAPQDLRVLFSPVSTATNFAPISLVGNPLKPAGSNPSSVYLYTPKFLAIQSITTGTPATCTYNVYGTLLTPVEAPVFPTDYSLLTSSAQNCGTLYYLSYVPAAQIVVSLTALSGGTTPTVSFRILAAH